MKKNYQLIFTIMLITLVPLVLPLNAQEPNLPLYACEYNPVLSKGEIGDWDSGSAFLPSIMYDEEDEIYYLFYTGSINIGVSPTSIGFATSHDGNFFTKFGLPVFSADGTGFDAHEVSDAIIIKLEDEWIMLYTAKDNPFFGPGKTIGRASAPAPEGPWTRLDDPVLESGPVGDWDYGLIAPRSVVEVDSGLMMFYYGSDENGLAGPWQVGMAFSDDNGYTWEKYNDPSTIFWPYVESDPVIPIGEPGEWDEAAVLGAGVIKTEEMFQAFYTGCGPGGYGIGYATSTDGINWDKDENNPQYIISDDPYAVMMGYVYIEIPSAIINAEGTHYYIYYDWGTGPGEIGMAWAEVDYNPGIPSWELNAGEALLHMVYPNPCSGAVRLRYQINEQRLTICDLFQISGKRIKRLMNEVRMPGEYEMEIDVSDLPAGIYIYRLQAGEYTGLGKIVKME